MLSLQEPRWDPCSSPENQRSGRSPFVFKAPRPSQALIDPVIRFIFSMKVCLFILENLGSKKRIQNFSLEVTLKIQTGFYVLGIQCFHASMLRCKKIFTRDKKFLLDSSQIEL